MSVTSLMLVMLLPPVLFSHLPKDPQISLIETWYSYVIENDYYIVVIPKAETYSARGIIKWLYVKKSNGEWSNNLVYEHPSNATYGLGFLEGTGTADKNRCAGLQNSNDITLTVLENTSNKIKIRARDDNFEGTDFTENWTFWAGKPFFQSDANAVVVDENGFLTNQFQFCWMINKTSDVEWYGTDENGNIVRFNGMEIQQLHSPNLNTYPWVNWKFTGENVSLGLVFFDIYDHCSTVAETGEWNFEYQMDFELGSGALGSPVKKGYKRKVTTIYYTSNQATNNDINNFAHNQYQMASTSIEQNPVLQAAQYVNNPYGQKKGIGSALVNSPYFLVRQNSQNMHYGPNRPQYETSIYAPLYKFQKMIHSGGYDFIDQLIYSLNYSNGSQSFKYGTIDNVNASNSDYETSLQMRATSSDAKLLYNSVFKTWNDSDKLKIEGSASNASSSALVEDIYVSLLLALPQNRYETETAGPSSYITSDLNSFDNLWTNYDYPYDSGTTLIYWDKAENVPALSIPLSLPSGGYKVTAYVAERPEGAITYRYSTDNSTWNDFTVARAGVRGIKAVDLGVIDISHGAFYIDDDNNAFSGINGWAGWDGVNFQLAPENIDSNIYDVRLYDEIYGNMGIAIKVNSPTNNISLVDNSEIRIYLYQEDTAQTLTDFNYPFDIEIYPHKGWLDSVDEFTSLHSQDEVNYIKHKFCEECLLNEPPVAFPTATPSFGEAPLTVQFEANASDPNNDPLTYAWDFGDPLSGDNNSTLENPIHIYDQNGLYHVSLDVNDGLITINCSLTIRVDPKTKWPPVALPTAKPSFGEAPLTVQFEANASDPNNDPLTYAWDFGDPLSGDNNSTLENPTHIYDQNGFYHVALDVCDGLFTINRSITIRVGRLGIDYLLGDIDFDGDVDYVDVDKFASAYLSENGDLNYNSDADLDPNNCLIDFYDFALLADDWRKTLP